MSQTPRTTVPLPQQVKFDLSNQKFHEWTVLRFLGTKNARGQWECKCSCGAIETLDSKTLRGGYKKSCGCKRGEMISARKKTHGRSETPEYRVWCMMKTRCYNKKRRDYRWYGADGIIVCDRWLNGDGTRGGFECFYGDMGDRPSPKHTIERKDSKQNYEPDNCEWMLGVLQPQNTRQVVKMVYEGEELCLSEVARRSGIKLGTLGQRVRHGWSHEDALKTSVMELKHHAPISFNGKTQTISQWADELGVTYQCIYKIVTGAEDLEIGMDRIFTQMQNVSAQPRA